MIFAPHATDFYKTGHKKMYPKGTSLVYSNFTPRSCNHFKGLDDYDKKYVVFGLQGVCQKLLIDVWNQSFFSQPQEKVISRIKRRMDNSLGKGLVDVDCWSNLHSLGYLPIHIKAIPEGNRVDIRVPMYTIKNTHPEFFWLTNYLETSLSTELWKGMTSATTAVEYRRLLELYADITGTDKAFVDWQGHDFSARGMSNLEDGAFSGAGHLLSFTGTDTILAIDYAEDYYFANSDIEMVGGSVVASEHAVTTFNGEENELETLRSILEDIYPSGVVSLVSDSYDYWKVMTEGTMALEHKILGREGKVVFRPDSGDPVRIIVGDSEAEPGTPEFKGSVECLWEVFGGTVTDKNYKLLDSHVGLIYGDSITLDIASRILQGLEKKGFASGNVVFGIGSYTYQMVSRDTLGTAIKCTYGVVNGEAREVFKNPKTDSGMKKSAKGLLRVEKEGSNFVLYDQQTPDQEKQGVLRTVFLNGSLQNVETFKTIRQRLKSGAS